MALFALGIIVFFGQRDVFGYFNMISSLFLPESGSYQNVLQWYFVIYAVSVVLIIVGVVFFYKGRKETNGLTPSSPSEKE